MRALGPGSVSSFLKIILDVAYYALFVLLALLGLAIFASMLLFAFIPDFLPALGSRLEIRGNVDETATLVPMLAAFAVYFTFYLGAMLAIFSRLRRVFATLTTGDPFHPENIRRLRVIGFVLAAMEIARYGLQAVLLAVAPGVERDTDGFNITVWFAVLVIFVLAEVFREGARLRNESELTI